MSEESLMDDVKETDDNKIVFDQLREAYTQLESKHMNQLKHWINTLVKMDLAVIHDQFTAYNFISTKKNYFRIR
jgi:hypothetical protein